LNKEGRQNGLTQKNDLKSKKGNISVSLDEPLAGIVPIGIADSDLLIFDQILSNRINLSKGNRIT